MTLDGEIAELERLADAANMQPRIAYWGEEEWDYVCAALKASPKLIARIRELETCLKHIRDDALVDHGNFCDEDKCREECPMEAYGTPAMDALKGKATE
jgi:hypothetical protein